MHFRRSKFLKGGLSIGIHPNADPLRVTLTVAKESGALLLPVDSEHNAIFQALPADFPQGLEVCGVQHILLTASGGPFREKALADLQQVTPEEACAHPNWVMGRKISVDSATMMNKGLEVIEARWLFDLAPEQLKVLIHPQSIVHALVGFRDGGVMAHLGPADMRHAIGFALHWPDRGHVPVERLDLARLGSLSFEAPDSARFPALRLAREVMQMRGLSGAAFNAAKEIALDHFMAGEIGFLDMAAVVEDTLTQLAGEDGLGHSATGLDDVLAMDHLARVRAGEAAQKLKEGR
jgi:1-deoxy-D-xylulose-5-phosphate reductoisomerase